MIWRLRIANHPLLEHLHRYAYALHEPEPSVTERGDCKADAFGPRPSTDRTRPAAFRFQIMEWSRPAWMPDDCTIASVNYFPAGGGLGWHTDSSRPGWRIYVARPLLPIGFPGLFMSDDARLHDAPDYAVAFRAPYWHAVHAPGPRFSVGLRVGDATAALLGLPHYTPDCQPVAKKESPPTMQTIENKGTLEEREGFEPSRTAPPNPASPAASAPASALRSVDLANALPAPHAAGALALTALAPPGACGCGARMVDHLTLIPISGYCILRKNARTAQLPGVLRITAVQL